MSCSKLILIILMSFNSGVRGRNAGAEHTMLVRDRREQAQDGVSAVPDVPRHLPEGHDLQLPVQRAAGAEDPPRVPRLRPVLRRTSVSQILKVAEL